MSAIAPTASLPRRLSLLTEAVVARGGVVLLALALLLAAWLLHVPRGRVVLMNDMLGYSAQARSLLHGEGNVVPLDAQRIPGYYPAGLPLLVAGSMAVLGDDLRNGQPVVWASSLLLLGLVFLLGRRAGGDWVGLAAVLVILASAAFRGVAELTLSQVPTAAMMAWAALLFVSPRPDGRKLFLAGLLASASLLLRYANASFPAALGLAALLVAGRSPAALRRWVPAVAAGLVAGAGLVALHNAYYYGGPLATGYALWGHHVEGQFSPRNILFPVMIGNRGDESLMLRSLAGFGELQQVEVTLASLWGCWFLLRRAAPGSPARRLGWLVLTTVACQDLFLACYAFRSESYLVPAQPLVAVVAAVGAADLLRRAWPRSGGLLVALAAAALLGGSLADPGPPDEAERQAIERHDSLARAGLELPADAALVTPSDFALVEPLFRGPDRRILYVGPFVSEVIERAAAAEVGREKFRSFVVAPWVGDRLREGRPVYLDQNPPPRGVVPLHKEVRAAIVESFRLEATPIPGLFRLGRKN